MPNKRPIKAEDLLRIKVVSDPQLSPDGSRILFTVKVIDETKNRYWSHLSTVSAQGEDARQFTFGEVNDASPRWSPDGRQIAFLRTKDKQTQIWIMPSDGGESRPLTQLDEGAVGEPKWSPDGKKIAFTFRLTPLEFTQKARKEREESGKSTSPRHISRLTYREDGFGWKDRRQHIWLCDTKTGDANQITDGDEDDHSITWSPDAKRLAFASNRSDDPEEKPYEVDIWLVSTKLPNYPTSQFSMLKTPTGHKGACSWSPDGKWIAYVGSESGQDPWAPKHDKVWIVSPKGGEVRCLTANFDRGIGYGTLSDVHQSQGSAQLKWTSDSSGLLFPASDKGDSRLYRVSLNGDKPLPITQEHQVATGLSLSADKVALVIATPTQLGDVHLIDLSDIPSSQNSKSLTDLHRGFYGEIQLAEPEEVWVDSTDAVKVQTWILKPPGFDKNKKYPLIFYIHGGPHLQYGNVIFHELQWHAARGYVVVYSNPRGSDNLTQDYMSCIRGAWGNKDYEDLTAVADYAEKLTYVDSKRMGVCGGSYGGYSTNWLISHTSRFKCAVSDRSVVNLVSMGQSDASGLVRPDGYWRGNSWDNPKTLLNQSPLTYMANCITPVLIIHSEGDWRCPIGQAQELFNALKRLKKCHVEFIWYPPETSHGMSRNGPPDLRLDRLNRYGEWFDRYLR